VGDDDVEMSWEFYFERVVDRHMVYLAGYPPELTFNIHKLGVRQLAILHNALKADPPTLYWAKATDDIVEELRKTAPIKTRKQRADKGKKRRVYKSGSVEMAVVMLDEFSDCGHGDA